MTTIECCFKKSQGLLILGEEKISLKKLGNVSYDNTISGICFFILVGPAGFEPTSLSLLAKENLN